MPENTYIKYSWISTYGPLAISTTSPQWTGFLSQPCANLYILLNLIEIFIQRPLYNGQLILPQGGQCGEVQMYIFWMQHNHVKLHTKHWEKFITEFELVTDPTWWISSCCNLLRCSCWNDSILVTYFQSYKRCHKSYNVDSFTSHKEKITLWNPYWVVYAHVTLFIMLTE